LSGAVHGLISSSGLLHRLGAEPAVLTGGELRLRDPELVQ
jgi:hypothetical protein